MGAFGPDELDGIYGMEYYMKLFELENEGINKFYAYENISDKKANNMASYFSGIKEYEIIGLLDTTLLGSAKEGYAFTEEKFLMNVDGLRGRTFKYEDIKKMQTYTNKSGFLKKRRTLKITLKDGSWFKLVSDESLGKDVDLENLKTALECMKEEANSSW